MQPTTTDEPNPTAYAPDPPAELPKRKTNFLLDAHRSLVDKYAGDADKSFFDSADFPWAKEFEANWRTIRRDLDEALAVREQIPGFGGVSTRQRRIADERWKTLVFYFFGRRVAENCDRFPETAALIERIPGMKTAMFSILTEGGHIIPHYGPYKGVLRYHLGLRVPPGDVAGIRVGGQVRRWTEGEGFFFDDTFLHEAWNRGPGDRVVLFVDILRPLPRGLDAFNRAFFQIVKNSPDVREVQSKASFFARLARKVRGESTT